jgi:hypothetical protein
MVFDPYVQNKTYYSLILDTASTGLCSHLIKRVALISWLQRLIRWTRVTKGRNWPLPLDGGGHFPALLESHGGKGSLAVHSPHVAVLTSARG